MDDATATGWMIFWVVINAVIGTIIGEWNNQVGASILLSVLLGPIGWLLALFCKRQSSQMSVLRGEYKARSQSLSRL